MATEKQMQVLEAIYKYGLEHGYSPAYTDIMEIVGVKSKSHISRIVRCLADAGYVTFMAGRSRSVELTRIGEQRAAKFSAIDLKYMIDAETREAALLLARHALVSTGNNEVHAASERVRDALEARYG